jgi:hypothetical protein
VSAAKPNGTAALCTVLNSYLLKLGEPVIEARPPPQDDE